MTQDVETRAREMGWAPKDQFRGDPEKWVDAETYVKRGEEVLPLVKAEARRLTEKADSLSREIAQLKTTVAEQRQSMDDMVEFNAQQLREKLAEQKRRLTAELREQNRADEPDDRRIAEIEEQLEANGEARQNLDKVRPKAPANSPAAAPPPPQETPEYKAWKEKNPWFGGSSRADAAKTAAAERFGVEIAAAGKRGQAFFDAVDEALADAFPQQRRQDPTEDARPSGSGGSSSSSDSSFSSLPADAKAKAREQSARFVGPNKMFKTEDAWFKYYAKQYNAEAA